jgi:hypothetical protein
MKAISWQILNYDQKIFSQGLSVTKNNVESTSGNFGPIMLVESPFAEWIFRQRFPAKHDRTENSICAEVLGETLPVC